MMITLSILLILEYQSSINFCCDSHEEMYFYNPDDLASISQVEYDIGIASDNGDNKNDDTDNHYPFNVQFRPEVGR